MSIVVDLINLSHHCLIEAQVYISGGKVFINELCGLTQYSKLLQAHPWFRTRFSFLSTVLLVYGLKYGKI